jgi:hypothetical protein
VESKSGLDGKLDDEISVLEFTSGVVLTIDVLAVGVIDGDELPDVLWAVAVPDVEEISGVDEMLVKEISPLGLPEGLLTVVVEEALSENWELDGVVWAFAVTDKVCSAVVEESLKAVLYIVIVVLIFSMLCLFVARQVIVPTLETTALL